jgi:hypothetical protein
MFVASGEQRGTKGTQFPPPGLAEQVAEKDGTDFEGMS